MGKIYVGIDTYVKPVPKRTTLTNGLISADSNLAATHVGNYALFGGSTNKVTAYDASLTRSAPTTLSYNLGGMAATHIGNYALFGGGYSSIYNSNYSRFDYTYGKIVNAYNTSLTRSIPTALSAGRGYLAATHVGNYALFGGGKNGESSSSNASSAVEAYDTSLTRSIISNLHAGARYLGAAYVGNYALFGGGYSKNSGTGTTSYFTAYDTSLTCSYPSVGNNGPTAGVNIGNYALFGGGGGSSPINSVKAYNTSLTLTTAEDLSYVQYYMAATHVGNYALFGGGESSSAATAYVTLYDNSLTKTNADNLSRERKGLAATHVGNYALFGGGTGTNTGSLDTVDKYEYISPYHISYARQIA